jgi:hypothetical protein
VHRGPLEHVVLHSEAFPRQCEEYGCVFGQNGGEVQQSDRDRYGRMMTESLSKIALACSAEEWEDWEDVREGGKVGDVSETEECWIFACS